ncbi:WecB/TagA/CpsF family glycosyltransferase [Thalassospira mesophila]|uniref:WecB/TagA/CpsF family glycosyltransferase n=1 Tax=Thalassospira mesophila TaxID=1293891 RepID=UPI001302472C|nr:WecB/TagA/CpsF family glycosyltransferase [Thalassospira mesophila]
MRDDILAGLEQNQRLRHISLNAIKLVAARKDAALCDALRACDCLSADGMGIVWAAKLLGYRLAGRVTGIDLMMSLMPGLAERRSSVFLLGAKPDIVARTRSRLVRDYPGLNIVGWRHGYEATDAEMADMVAQSGADVVFVALPSPRKERFVVEYAEACGARLLIGVGGAFDVISGQVKRAPQSWQNAGMEWLWRVLQAPRAMSPRYAKGLFQFAILVARQGVKSRSTQIAGLSRIKQFSLLAIVALMGGVLGAGSAWGQTVPAAGLTASAVMDPQNAGAQLTQQLSQLAAAEGAQNSENVENGDMVRSVATVMAGFFTSLVLVQHPGILPVIDGQTLTSILGGFFENPNSWDAKPNAGTVNDAQGADTAQARQNIGIKIISSLEQCFAQLIVQQFIPATLMGGIQGILMQALLVAILRYGKGGGDPAQLAYRYAPGLSAAAFGMTGDGVERVLPVNQPAQPAQNTGIDVYRPGVVGQVFASPDHGDKYIPAPFDDEKPLTQNPDGNDDWWPDDASPR